MSWIFRLALFLLLALLAALLGYYLRLDAGMVYVRFQGWEVETTVVFLGLGLERGATAAGRGSTGLDAAAAHALSALTYTAGRCLRNSTAVRGPLAKSSSPLSTSR